MSDVLERGHIFFLYKPDVETPAEHEQAVRNDEPEAEGLSDVHRFYIVLASQGEKKRYRLLILGQKKLPEIAEGGGGQKYWGFVEKVSNRARSIESELEPMTYQTKTRGERFLPAARPIGVGVYAIVRHEGDHTHLAYVLDEPAQHGKVQKAERLEPRASYIITIRNPATPSPPGVGLRGSREAKYPKRLLARFHGRRFVPADPPDFLNYPGTEFILIAARDEPNRELGTQLAPESETRAKEELFQDLQLQRRKRPLEPLFTGNWE